MKKYYLFASLVLLAASPAFAQTKIGAAGAPDPSAMLEVTSGTAGNKGLLMPRMTTTQRNAITNPAKGLMIYNTTTNEAQVNTGTPAAPTWTAATAAIGWNTTGNTGSNPASNFIGTTDNQPLSIRTNNTETIRVTADGNVGVGTTTPAVKLQVTDTGDVAIRVGTTTTGKISVNLGLGNGYHGISRNLTSSGGGANDVALYTASGPSTPASIHLSASPTATDSLNLTQFVLKNTGNVGIGTNDPLAKLHVNGNARITGSSGTATTVTGRNAAGDISNVTIGAGLNLTGGTLTTTAGGNNWGLTGNAGSNPATNFIGTTDNQPLTIRTNNTAQMRVTAAGYVGIGTTAPIAKLNVVDTGNTYVVVGSSTGGTSNLSLGNGHHGITRNLTGSGGTINDVALYTTSGGSPVSLYLAAKPAISDSVPLNQFVLKSNGNVGIGVTVPKVKLQVQGGLLLRNDVNIAHGNGTFITWSTVRSGVGETEFINYRGTGSGGFRFYDVNPGLSVDTAVDLPALSGGNQIAFIAPGTGAYSALSDMRVKTNVNVINDGLEKVMAVRPVSYDLHTERKLKDGIVTFGKNDKTINTIGFIAQELEKVVPEAVIAPKDPANEFYTVSYSIMIPVLTKAIQEQQAQIEALKAKNEQLEAANKITAQLMERVKQMEQMMGINEIEGTSKVAGK